MSLYDDILDLLDLVGRRECLVRWGGAEGCELDECESCRARRLYRRLVEARDRAEPQPDPIGDFGRSGYLRPKS